MANNEKAVSIADYFERDVADYVGEISEFTLDMFLEDGAFKDFPVLSSVSAVYRLGKSFSEFAHIKKLISFINALNKGCTDEEKRSDYIDKLKANEKFRNQELEYILVLIERYIGTTKPEMLGRIYLAYLDGKISWEEFTMYAEVIDRFFPSDYRILKICDNVVITRNIGSEPLLRLMSQGLVAEVYYNESLPFGSRPKKTYLGAYHNPWSSSGQFERMYQRTEFGEKLIRIIGEL